jgi:hypothetical protein
MYIKDYAITYYVYSTNFRQESFLQKSDLLKYAQEKSIWKLTRRTTHYRPIVGAWIYGLRYGRHVLGIDKYAYTESQCEDILKEIDHEAYRVR